MKFLESSQFEFVIRSDERHISFEDAQEFFAAMAHITKRDILHITSISTRSDGASIYWHTVTGAMLVRIGQ